MIMIQKRFTCELCSSTFFRRNGKRVYRFCSRTCSATVNARGNRTYDALYERWQRRFGDVEARRLLDANVKPAWLVASPTREMVLKSQAVIENGSAFRYLTDKDMR